MSELGPTLEQNFQIDPAEWEFAKEQIKLQQGSSPSLTSFKISRNEHADKLKHSFICIRNDKGDEQIFAVGEMLGKGAFGKVKLLIDEKGNKYAVKISDAAKRDIQETEIAILGDLGHLMDEFVRTRETEKQDKYLNRKIKDKHYLIQSYFPGKNLAESLAKGNFSQVQKTEIALQAAQSVKRLHVNEVVHRDLKALNFMLSTKQNGEIDQVNTIDFGLALRMGGVAEVKTKVAGTARYLAPELDSKRINQVSLEAFLSANLYEKTMAQLKYLESSLVKENARLKEMQSANEQIKELFLNKMNADVDDFVRDKGKIHELSMTITDDELYDEIENQLQEYNSNLNQITETTSTIEAIKGQLKKGAEEFKDIRQNAIDKQNLQHKLMSQEFPVTKAVDVYALGVMFSQDMGMNLDQLGLSRMLADDPKDRMTILEVEEILEIQFSLQIEEKNKKDNLKNLAESRVPEIVSTDDLYIIEGKYLSLLTSTQLGQVKSIKEQYKNQLIELSPEGKAIVLPPKDIEFLANKKLDKINKKLILIDKEGTPFILYQQLAPGSAGRVYLTQNLQDGSWAVLKMISGVPKKVGPSIKGMEYESQILNNLGDLKGTLNITTPLQNTSASLQTYAHGQEFFDIHKEAKKDRPISAQQSMDMAKKALQNLAELHHQGYLHRDIKLENLIWDNMAKKCRIIDLGNAIQSTEVIDPTIKGTKGYLAPELDPSEEHGRFKRMFLEGRKYNRQTDLYSMGEVIDRLSDVTQQGPQQRMLKDIASRLKAVDPAQRPSAKEAIAAIDKIVQMDLTLESSANLSQRSFEHRAAPLTLSLNLGNAAASEKKNLNKENPNEPITPESPKKKSFDSP